ncbi:unnamed protein product [Chironomus riparius]|uniref:Ionotropic receptor n=1 Tax=Chironomus riparius TaxID=315576 RepID=A0A9N9S5Z1_9DIPT|nr:unnamed protein product [Chironomus riparius]
MKINKFFAQFLALLIFNSTVNTQIDNKLSSYVCKITKDVTKSNTDTQDVLIVNLAQKMWSSTLNDIAGCVGHDNAVVVSDFNDVIIEKTLRKAAIIVIALGLATQLNLTKRLQIMRQFMLYGFFDVAVVYQNDIGSIKFELFHTLKMGIRVLTEPEQSKLVFPDKLKMAGLTYKVIAYSQAPRVIVNSKGIASALMYFLDTVVRLQKANYELYIISDLKDIKMHWMNRAFHLCLSNGVIMETYEQKLLTYEENGDCALVPLPPKVPIFQSIFIEPFDGLTWLFFVLTTGCSVAVWWMFHGRGAVDSAWLLGYGMFVMFIGQGIDFSRKNRLVLAFLLELIIVMVWILCNAYEGVITSFMIQPIQEHRLETFDDLVASDYKIFSDTVFASKISTSEAYKVLMPRLNSSAKDLYDEFFLELARKNYVFIISCDQAEVIVNQMLPRENKRVSEFYYLLPKKFLPSLVQLEASYLNPVLDILQYYMDLSFQAGLLYIWELFHYLDSPYTFRQEISDQFEYLKFEDLTQVFSILVGGYVITTALFLNEVFFHDILGKLKLACLAHKFKNRVHQMAYKKRKQARYPKYQKGNFGSHMWSSTINHIALCLGADNPMIITRFMTFQVTKILRKATVVIITVDYIDLKIFKLIVQRKVMTNIQHFMAKLLIITPNTILGDKTDEALEIFSDFGVLNIAFIHQTENGDIQVKINASLVSQQSLILNQPDASLIFPDKLKDMQGFTYRIAVNRQHPRIYIVNGKYVVEPSLSRLGIHWLQRTMHLTLNSALRMTSENREPELLVYEQNGYCALVPLPPKTTLFQSIFIQPFDGLTWLFFVFTMLCTVAVFWMFHGRGAVNSPWLLAYGIFVIFIGQGIDFSRKNRLVLTILLQLIIVMVWILSNAYEGVITSFMIQPIEGEQFSTFDQLIASDYEIIADDLFALDIKDSEAYKSCCKLS